MSEGLQELRRRGVGARDLRVGALKHQGTHDQADADPEQGRDHVRPERYRQDAASVFHAPAHHHLRDDVRLTGEAKAKYEVPGQRVHHSRRAPGRHRLRIVGHDRLAHPGEAAIDRHDRGQQNEHRGEHHHEALDQVGVDRSDDAAGDAVEHQHRTRKGDAGLDADTASQRAPQNVLKNCGHRQNLGRQIAHHPEQDGESSQ